MSETPFQKYLREAYEELAKPLEERRSDFADVELSVKKGAVLLSASSEMLTDCGVIPDTRPPAPPPTRQDRARWARAEKREARARRAYERISGNSFPEEDDW